jgi:5-methylcytosine-specific restriction endonuclease McrA
VGKTTPGEQADWCWTHASALRLLADDLENHARELRCGRQPMDHERYFALLARRDWEGLLRDGQGACDYCYRTLHPHDGRHQHAQEDPETCAQIEHRTPVSRGGTNELDNLALSCLWCNARKGTMTEREYRVVLAIDGMWAGHETCPSEDVRQFAMRVVSDLVDVVVAALPQYNDKLQTWQFRVMDAIIEREAEPF